MEDTVVATECIFIDAAGCLARLINNTVHKHDILVSDWFVIECSGSLFPGEVIAIRSQRNQDPVLARAPAGLDMTELVGQAALVQGR